MANAKYNILNQLASATSVTVGGAWAEDADHPKENLYNYRMSKRAGFDTAKTGTLTINLGSAKAIDFCAIMNHNLTSSATVRIQGGTIDEYFTYRAEDMIEVFTATETQQNWTITIDDSTRSANDIRIGELILGPMVTLDRNYDWEVSYRPHKENIRHTTYGGNEWIYNLSDGNVWTLKWSKLSSAQLVEITDIWEGVTGNSTPWLLVMEDIPYYVRFESELDITKPINRPGLEDLGSDWMIIDYALEQVIIKEEVRGLSF